MFGGDLHAQQTVNFQRDIRPILSDVCFACHGPDDQARQANLRLDSLAGATADLGGHAAVVPGHPESSALVERVTTNDPEQRMPPPDHPRQLTAKQVDLLSAWVAQGAQWEEHWAFKAPARPALPGVSKSEWPLNAIDFFVLAKLDAEHLAPSPQAERTTLIRRATLDLTGLPPSPQEVEAFLRDESPDAYEKVVDRLLNSPRYGERMALDWLDAARYADTDGYQVDAVRDLWPWREWVIAAFNRNMPFDQFTIEQLAGDQLPNATTEQRVATGFNRNHRINGESGVIPEEYRVEYVADRVDTTATVWLGLTMGCARCHDHKYDPVTMREFYQFFAFFNNIPEQGVSSGKSVPLLALPTSAIQQQLGALDEKIVEAAKQVNTVRGDLEPRQIMWEATILDALDLPDPIRAALFIERSQRTPEQHSALAQHYLGSQPRFVQATHQLEALRQQRAATAAAIPTTMVMQDAEQARDTFILVRGAYDKPGEKVPPGVPAVLSTAPSQTPTNRLDLAQWLVNSRNPLTARVIVNRFWQSYFGLGLVRSTENFGSQGQPPSHPELLDWLATEFMESGWDVKQMQRLIVTSATYRQTSRLTPDLVLQDPENRLLARGPRLRLSAENIRDQALSISGLLTERLGGPSVKPNQPAGLWEELTYDPQAVRYVESQGADLYRRSLYTFWKRTVPPPGMTTFDAPSREYCIVRRARTSTPLQALALMNDVIYVEAARKMAERMLLEVGAEPMQRLSYGMRLATGREPSPDEAQVLLNALERRKRQFLSDGSAAEKLLAVGPTPRNPALDTVELAAYSAVAGIILNLDEVITKE